MSDEMEARLRRALSARAGAVEPSTDDAETLQHRAAEARRSRRRRLALLSVAAVVVVAGLAAAVVLDGRDDDDELQVADTTTTTLPADDRTVIWPLPSMSIAYATPVEAAQAFYDTYLGRDGTSTCAEGTTGGDVECTPCPPNANCVEAPVTTVTVTDGGPRGWGVVGAEGESVSVGDLAGSLAEGLHVSGTVRSLDVRGVTITAELRALGELEPVTTGVWAAQLVDATTGWSVALEPSAASLPVVLVVDDGRTAGVQVIGDDTPIAPTTTTSSTSTTAAPPDDDGVPGWPGFTSRMFSEPEPAALAFVTDVLGFAEPALADVTTEGTEAEVVYHPRPTAGISTTIVLHHTGDLRGWVVTGARSDQGTIESVSFDGTGVSVSGSATAYEATVHIAVLDQEGDVLAESFSMAGANGEQGPYSATVDVDPAVGTPFWVLIAESDASGEGDFLWATTARL